MIDILKPTDFSHNFQPFIKIKLFDFLIEAKIPFAVVCAYITANEMPEESGHDFCIIVSIKDESQVKNLGFYQTGSHDLITERKLNQGAEINKFKAMVRAGKFRLVQDDCNGKIWEYYTVNNFVAYCGGKIKKLKK